MLTVSQVTHRLAESAHFSDTSQEDSRNTINKIRGDRLAKIVRLRQMFRVIDRLGVIQLGTRSDMHIRDQKITNAINK